MVVVLCVCCQLLNSMLAEEKLGIDGVGALFPVSQVCRIMAVYIRATHIHFCIYFIYVYVFVN